MASAPGSSAEVRGRVDPNGRLVEAAGMLAELQQEAGGAVGQSLLLPQLAAIARLVRKLGIPVARSALVAASDHDLDLWVRGEPDGDDVVLVIESWRKKSPPGPRLESVTRGDPAVASPKGEWAVDNELRFTELSGDLAEQLGTTPNEAVGQPLTKWLKLVESDEGSMPMLISVAARTAFEGQEAMGRGSNAAKITLSGSPVTAPDGQFAGFRGRAVPEKKADAPTAANETGNASLGIDPELDRALRSPIDRILKAAEGISDRSEGPLRRDYATYADDIASAARHLLSVIRSMVDQPPGSETEVDMVSLAEEAIGLVEPNAEEKKVAIHLEGSDALAAVGEPRAIVQILVNLLGNAVRHTPSGTNVSVSLATGTDFASVTVADEGKGIEVEDQERIFERFESSSEGGGSSGLGLAIARRLARTMGGDINLVSTPGEGARFTLSLPLAYRSSTGT